MLWCSNGEITIIILRMIKNNNNNTKIITIIVSSDYSDESINDNKIVVTRITIMIVEQ